MTCINRNINTPRQRTQKPLRRRNLKTTFSKEPSIFKWQLWHSHYFPLSDVTARLACKSFKANLILLEWRRVLSPAPNCKFIYPLISQFASLVFTRDDNVPHSCWWMLKISSNAGCSCLYKNGQTLGFVTLPNSELANLPSKFWI